jgi:hypothetical protein
MRRTNILAGAGAALLALGTVGCSDPEYSFLGAGRVNSAAPTQMLAAPNETFSAGRLAIMIEAMTKGEAMPLDQPGDGVPLDPLFSSDAPVAVARLDRALANFAKAPYTPGLDANSRALTQNRLRDARNMIQDQLIAASNNRCNAYKTHLRRLSSNTGFALGGLATVAGAAGAVVTGGASQALAGAAAALSGVNAQFKEEFFNGLITAVIIPGIDRQRGDVRNDIVAKTCKNVTDYPLTLAIAEAVRYHGACSADVGIAASGQAISRIAPDSLPAVLAAAQQIERLRNTFTALSTGQIRSLKQQDAAARQAVANLTDNLARASDDLAKALTDNPTDPGIAARRERVEQLRRRLAEAKVKSETLKAAVGTIDAGSGGGGAGGGGAGDPQYWQDPVKDGTPLVGRATDSVSCPTLDQDGMVARTPPGR